MATPRTRAIGTACFAPLPELRAGLCILRAPRTGAWCVRWQCMPSATRTGSGRSSSSVSSRIHSRPIAWKHAPPPLAASGLDMRGGHPARVGNCVRRLSKSRFSRLGAFVPAPSKLTAECGNSKHRPVSQGGSAASSRPGSRPGAGMQSAAQREEARFHPRLSDKIQCRLFGKFLGNGSHGSFICR